MANTNDPITDKNSGSRAPHKSLVAFLQAIKFRKPSHRANDVKHYFAQPHPQARQRQQLAEESFWIRSAN